MAISLHHNPLQSSPNPQHFSATSQEESRGGSSRGKSQKAKGKQPVQKGNGRSTLDQESSATLSREAWTDVGGKSGIDDLVNPRPTVSRVIKRQVMPGSFFTPATPVILPQAEDRPESSKATSSEPSLDLEIVELIKSTGESLL